jgi:hypothetical protein
MSDSIPNQRKEEEEYFKQQSWPWDESLCFSDNDLSASNLRHQGPARLSGIARHDPSGPATRLIG